MKTLDELDALHAAATAGEWYRDERGYIPGVAVTLAPDGSPTLDGRSVLRGNNAWPAECRANEDFAMHAKNAWPAISARLRAAEAEVERLRGALVAKGDRVVHRLTKGRIRGTVIRVMAEVAVDGVPRPVMSPLEYDVENLEREPAARAALGET